jgi:hypothetical protein
MKSKPIRSHIKRWLLLTPVVAQCGCVGVGACASPFTRATTAAQARDALAARQPRLSDGGVMDGGFLADGGALPETITAENCRAFCEAAFGHFGFLSCTVGVADGGEPAAECMESPNCTGRRPEGLVASSEVPARSRVATYLAASARLELASVPAFVRLGRELKEHGAPAKLVRATRRAARDEVRHARVMSQLALDAGGQPTLPEVAAVGARDLETVLTENRVEGCIRETYGALIGARQAMHARSPELRQAMTSIATDEIVHAELSWEIARWGEPSLSAAARKRIAKRARAEVKALEQALQKVEAPEVRAELGLPELDESLALFGAVRRELWS